MDENDGILWRYMKVSTLLLLLQGRAWFPSVAALRSGDPLESALGDQFYRLLWRRFVEREGGEAAVKWLRESRDWGDVQLEVDAGDIHEAVYGKCVADDIAAARTAWCWFASDIESAAMWSIYGHQGVAVMTTTSRLRESLPAGKELNVGEMVYVDRRGSSEHNIARLCLRNPDLVLRPYFLKAIEFGHEKEVRVVGHCPEREKGSMIGGIRSDVLVRKVVVSPLLPEPEADAIQDVIVQQMNGVQCDVVRSTLTGSVDRGRDFVAQLNEGMYSTTDEHIDKNRLPPALRSL